MLLPMPSLVTISLSYLKRCGGVTALNPYTTGTGRATGHQPSGLDCSKLQKLVRELFTAGLAQSTQRSYKSGERRYLQFCSATNRSPYPVSERGLSTFIAQLYQQGLSPSTMKSYLVAVRHTQIAMGFGDPIMAGMPQLQYVLKGAHRNLAGRPKRTRLLITPQILRALKTHGNRMDAVMLWAASTLCLFAFFGWERQCPLLTLDLTLVTIWHMVMSGSTAGWSHPGWRS